MHPRMSKKLLYATLAVALAAVAVVAFALPAGAAQRTFKVKLATGSVITVTVEAACVPMDQVPGLGGTPIEDITPPGVCPEGDPAATPPPTPPPAPPVEDPGDTPPHAGNGDGNGDG